MTHQAISKYERGLSVPKLVVIKQWAACTKVPLEWFLEDEPEPVGKSPASGNCRRDGTDTAQEARSAPSGESHCGRHLPNGRCLRR